MEVSLADKEAKSCSAAAIFSFSSFCGSFVESRSGTSLGTRISRKTEAKKRSAFLRCLILRRTQASRKAAAKKKSNNKNQTVVWFPEVVAAAVASRISDIYFLFLRGGIRPRCLIYLLSRLRFPWAEVLLPAFVFGRLISMQSVGLLRRLKGRSARLPHQSED